MSGILGGIINALSAAQAGNQRAKAEAAQQNISTALQVAQINRQSQEDRLKQVIADRQAKHEEERDRVADAIRQQQFGLQAFHSGLVPVQPGDQGQPSAESEVPMPAGPRYQFGSNAFEYHSDLDPINRKQTNALEQIDERGSQSRLTRGTPPGGMRGAQGTTTAKRSQYILRRIPQLTKSSKGLGGMVQPGMGTDDAIRHAGDEFDRTQGGGSPQATLATPASPRVSANDTPGDIDLGGPSQLSPDMLAAHQKIDANAAAAIKGGADPQKVAARANQLHAKLLNGGSQ